MLVLSHDCFAFVCGRTVMLKFFFAHYIFTSGLHMNFKTFIWKNRNPSIHYPMCFQLENNSVSASCDIRLVMVTGCCASVTWRLENTLNITGKGSWQKKKNQNALVSDCVNEHRIELNEIAIVPPTQSSGLLLLLLIDCISSHIDYTWGCIGWSSI